MLYKRNNPQLNKNGELIHLLSTEGLSKDILTVSYTHLTLPTKA